MVKKERKGHWEVLQAPLGVYSWLALKIQTYDEKQSYHHRFRT
jgi:hypothetical protein